MSAVIHRPFMPSARVAAAVLAAAVVGLLFYGVGSYGLLDNNEGLYAKVGWDMLKSGDWVIPRVDGLPYVEKPPLLYWLLAASFSAFGKTAFAARLVPALAGLAQLGLLLALGRVRGSGHTGVRAAVVLATSAGFFVMARTVMFDLVFAAFLNAALVAFFLAVDEDRRRWQRLGYLALALAVLTKGFVALALYLPVACVWALMQPAGERRRVFLLLADGPAVAVFLAVAAPWHVLASLADPGFAWFYFINEHLLRYLGMREPHDYYSGSPFYHLPRLFAMLAPWSLLAPLMFRRRLAGAALPPVERFFLLVALVELAFFSVSSAKANYYLVIALPPLAWLVAAAIERWSPQRPADRRRLAGVGIVAVAWPALLGSLLAAGNLRGVALPSPEGFAIGSCVAAGLAAWSFGHGRPDGLLAAMAVGAAAALVALVPVAEHNQGRFGSMALATAAARLEPGRDVFLYRDFERYSAFAFYFEGPLRIVDSESSDLWYARHSPGTAESFPAFSALARFRGHGAIVVGDERRAEFLKRAAAGGLAVTLAGRFENGAELLIF